MSDLATYQSFSAVTGLLLENHLDEYMNEDLKQTPEAGGMAYEQWLKLIGRDSVTGWRWAKAGIVTTTNILGRQYIETSEISRFWTRARAGEFALDAKGACKSKTCLKTFSHSLVRVGDSGIFRRNLSSLLMAKAPGIDRLVAKRLRKK